jgi:hypothetical protein
MVSFLMTDARELVEQSKVTMQMKKDLEGQRDKLT